MRPSALTLSLVCWALGACGGGGGGNSVPAPTSYKVGGTVSGLVPAPGAGSQLVLRVNGGDSLYLNADGPFVFSQALTPGAAYDVTIAIGPVAPPEKCSVSGATGQAGPASSNAVTIACVLSKYTISGMVSGLTGSGLVMSDNGTDDLRIPGDGPFTFVTPIQTGDGYDVEVVSQPTSPAETCTVNNGSGSVFRTPVTNVAVICQPNLYTVSGSVSGLTGAGLVLSIIGSFPPSPPLGPISANGPFTFSAPILATGANFLVMVVSQPANQTCVIPVNSGTISGASVNSISVICAAPHIAYGAGGHRNSVLAYAVDFASGALTPVPGSPFAAGDTTTAVAVDPRYRFLFATNEGATGGPGSNTVSAYTIDAGTGALTPVPGSPFVSVNAPNEIQTDLSGRFVYVANYHNNTISAYAVDPTSAALTPIAGGPPEAGIDGPRHITLHPSGKFLYMTAGNEGTIWGYAIDAATGALTPVAGSPFTALLGVVTFAINPDGLVGHVANAQAEIGQGISDVQIDPVTGALAGLTTPNFFIPILASALAEEPGGEYLYAMYQPLSGKPGAFVNSLELVPWGDNSFGFFPGDATLNSNSLSPLNFVNPLASIIADPSGRFIYVVDTSGDAYAYSIDHATGVLTPAATTPAAFTPLLSIAFTKQ